MCIFFAIILAAVAFVVWAVRLADREPGGLGAQLPTVVGAALVLASFVLLPWVEFSPAQYVIDTGSELFGDYLPDVLALLLRLLGKRGAAIALRLLDSVGGLTGWMLAVGALLPAGDWLVTDWPMRITILLVPLVGLLSFLWLAFTLFFPRQRSARLAAAWVQTSGALFTAGALLTQMPKLDSLAREANLFTRFLSVIFGTQMGTAVWLAWLGLLLIGAGGFSEAISVSGMRPSPDNMEW